MYTIFIMGKFNSMKICSFGFTFKQVSNSLQAMGLLYTFH